VTVNKTAGSNDPYYFVVYNGSDTGSCPIQSGTTANVNMRNALYDNSTYQITQDVPAGDCQSLFAIIRKTSDDSVVDIKEIHINNV